MQFLTHVCFKNSDDILKEVDRRRIRAMEAKLAEKAQNEEGDSGKDQGTSSDQTAADGNTKEHRGQAMDVENVSGQEGPAVKKAKVGKEGLQQNGDESVIP